MGEAPRQRARRQFGLATLQQAVGMDKAGDAEQTLQTAEATRGGMERFLGSDEQLSGELFQGLEYAPFRERFAINEGILGAATTRGAKGQRGISYFDNLSKAEKRNILGDSGAEGVQSYFRGQVDQANALLDQAEEAARGGDFTQAEELKRQANAMIEGTRMPAGFSGELFTRTGGLTAEERAAQSLQGPQAQIVGKMVREAEDFLDPASAATLRFKEDVTRGALDATARGAVNAQRSQQRAARDFAAQQGGGARAIASQILQQRATATVEGEAAFQKAQIVAKTDQFFASFSREFAANAVATAQAFINNSAGVRDQFTQALAQMQNLAANFAATIAQQGQAAYDSYRQINLQERAMEKSGKISPSQIMGSVLGFSAALLAPLSGAGSSIGAAGGGANLAFGSGATAGGAGATTAGATGAGAAGGTSAASTVAAGAAAACHCAAEYFGWHTPEWYAARWWILVGWPKQSMLGRAWRAFYVRHSERLARLVRRSSVIRNVLHPLFVWASRKGM